MPAFRMAHFSDIHLTAKPLGWHPRDWFSKRISGWFNVKMLGRGRRFREAPTVIKALVSGLADRQLDALIFSGDATGMGFESELVVASLALKVDSSSSPPAIAVPGNHDYYTRRAIRHGYFEKHFAPWLAGERIGGHTYPFARKIGGIWFLGVNSCTVNRGPTDASGAIGFEQLDRLRQLCGKLDDGLRVMVTHYPLRAFDGLVEPRLHRLRDHAAALEAARECKVSLWLHGHIHRPFVLKPTGAIPFPVICAGSATQDNRTTYYEYTIEGNHLGGVRRVYDGKAGRFLDADFFDVELAGAT